MSEPPAPIAAAVRVDAPAVGDAIATLDATLDAAGAVVIPVAALPAGTTVTITIAVGPAASAPSAPAPAPEPGPRSARYLGTRQG